MPAVYDDEKTKDDELRKITGINPADEKAMEARVHDELARAEAAGGEPAGDKAADKEQDKLDDQVGKGYTGDDEKAPSKGQVNGRRRQGIIAGSLVTLAVGAGGMGFLGAPNFIVNHLRELLLGKISELQTHQTRRYRRTKIRKISDMFTRDGRRASKLITEMESRGYRPKWDGNTLLGFEMPGGRSGTIGLGTIEEIEAHLEKKHPLRSSRWKTKQMESMYSRYNIPRKSVVLAAANDLDESADRIINKRIAEGILGDDSQSTRADAEKPPDGVEESETDRAAREERNARARDIIEQDGTLSDVKEKLKAGTPLTELDIDERAVLRLGMEFDTEVIDMLNRVGASGSLGSKIVGGIKGIGSSAVADLADKVCTIKGRLAGAIFAARIYRARALMQYASIFISPSDQTRLGGVSSLMMGKVMQRVTSLDGNDRPIGASSGFSSILKGKFSKSKNDASKTAYSVDGSLTGFPKKLHDITSGIPGTNEGQCAVWQNPATQIGAAAAEIVIGIVTGGAGKAGATTLKETIKIGFKEALQNIVSKQTLKSLAWTAAIELSFEGAMVLLQMQAEKALSLNFTGQETGAQLGEILAGGAGTMNKQRSLQAGMVPATATQYAQAQAEYIAWKKEETKKLSFYERIFDYGNYDSVAFNLGSVVATMPMTPRGIGLSIGNSLSKVSSSVLSNPTSLFSGIGSAFMGRVSAQASDEVAYDTFDVKGTSLATDHAGNLLPIMRTDIENIDPEENIKYLLSIDQIDPESYQPVPDSEFDKHITNCVESIDTLSVLESKDQSKPEFDCLAKLDKTKKYKAHLAYLDMTDGIDAWLFPEEIANSSGSTGGGSADPTSGNVSEPSYAANPNVKVDGSPPGPHRASNCTGTFTVGAASLKAVIEERWKPPVTSIGGYACRKNTASPGTSIHGLGRALDVMIDSTSPEGLAKGNEIRNWVINNSTQLGVQRVIWNNYTWAANRDGWREYTGPNPHTDHLHIEINLEASTKGNLGR